MLWALAVEPRRLAVRRRTLALAGWPAALDGLRVVLVSDLHAAAPHVSAARVARVARRAGSERAELALVLGDLVDADLALSRPVAPGDVAVALRELRGTLGTIAVLGNHDWAAGGDEVAAALRSTGITVLENDAVAVAARGTRLWVAGVADATTREPDVDAALEAVPEGEPVLLLSHDPDVFPRVPAGVALTVSGHTHGGQVDLPGVRARVIPSRFGARYARGHVLEGGRQLFVTSGVGMSRWPVRLRRPPEIVVLTLAAGR